MTLLRAFAIVLLSVAALNVVSIDWARAFGNFVMGGARTQKTRFMEYPAAPGAPSDWVLRWADTSRWTLGVANIGTSPAENALRWSMGSPQESGIHVASWNRAGNVQDAEILVRTRYGGTLGSSAHANRVILRGSGNLTTRNGYVCSYLRSSDTNHYAYIGAYKNSQYVGAIYRQTQLPSPISSNTWMWIRFRADGDRFYCKIWQVGNIEPNWQVTFDDATDDLVNATVESGWIGIGAIAESSNQVDYDFISYGINGQTAPMP